MPTKREFIVSVNVHCLVGPPHDVRVPASHSRPSDPLPPPPRTLPRLTLPSSVLPNAQEGHAWKQHALARRSGQSIYIFSWMNPKPVG